ncbi:MAG: M48 family metalloprotease [Chloroflexi bacterium]|nr:M48 family metalloprotease [Chloroflexota bacterium]
MEDKKYQQRQQIAVKYASRRRLYSLLELGLTAVLFVAVFIFSKFLAALFNNWASFWAATVYFIVLAIAYFIIIFPVRYAKNYRLSKDVGLLKQAFGRWLGDYIKTPLLILVVGALAFGLLYLLIVATPVWWWLWVASTITALSFILSFVYPVIIMPLMYRTCSMEAGFVKDAVDDIIKRSGVPVSRVDILQVADEEESSNAMIMGFGKTRRMAFTDTLLKDYTPSEIQVICAHELGHIKEGHFIKSFAVSFVLTLVILFLTSFVASLLIGWLDMGDITTLSSMPLTILVFVILYAIFTIFSNKYSRKEEAQADLYALKLTDNPDAFISMLQKLISQNLDEESPEAMVENLMYDHPAPETRLAMARAYKEGKYK